MQYAYQRGKSTESALHQLVSRIEMSFSDKEISLVTFLDIEETFDKVNPAALTEVMRMFELGHTLERCTTSLH